MWRGTWTIPLVLFGGCSTSPQPSASVAAGDKVDRPGLENVYRITDKLYCGAAPDGEVGFTSLEQLGVKTVISVDGSKPDVGAAHRHGLHYVHLPIGYDGVPRDQALRIAKAVCDLPGPIYLHCHHGQHRGRAAAAVAHVFLDSRCTPDDAVAEMKRAGTGPRYEGLYASPRRLSRPTSDEIDSVAGDFPEVANVTGFAQAMVAIDGCWDNLKAIKKAGWKTPAHHADLTPAHETLQLQEQFREAGRLPEVRERPEEFRQWLKDAEHSAAELQNVLTGRDIGSADSEFRKLASSCSRCHAGFRDPPHTR